MPKIEKILAMDSGSINLVVDIPEQEIKALIVFCHGLTGDRSGPQRILTCWAKTLSTQGYLVARFDFRGSGDSSGQFEKSSFTQMQEDLDQVIAWCFSHFNFSYFVLAGLSLGGVVVLNALRKHKKCRAVCLFSTDVRDNPPFDLSCDPLSIREGQFFLHRQFFDERLSIFPEQILVNSPLLRIFFYGSNDSKFASIVQRLEGKGIRLIKIEGAGHLFESIESRTLVVHRLIDELELLNGRKYE